MQGNGKPLFSRENIEKILSVVPKNAACCYTGQSILAYCPNPTFDWEELNNWTEVADVDFFAYNKPTLAALTQAFIENGWEPASGIDQFKAEKIRFFDPPRSFTLQTVALSKADLPNVNLTWHQDSTNLMATVGRFDMDYLMVGMDMRTRAFFDMRGPNHRIANVNKLNSKFDLDNVDVMFWVRQFDRIPKGYARGIDTRPVAETYLKWLEESIKRGDWNRESKSRFYADRQMNKSIATVVEAGFTEEQAKAMYHLFRREDNTWEAMKISLESMQRTIYEWLESVKDD